MGVLVGSFYTVHFLASGTLWEGIGLHLVNNLLSSLLVRSENLEDLLQWNILLQGRSTTPVSVLRTFVENWLTSF